MPLQFGIDIVLKNEQNWKIVDALVDASTLSERYRDEAEELNKSNHIKPYNQLTPINKDGVIPYETSLELHEFKQ